VLPRPAALGNGHRQAVEFFQIRLGASESSHGAPERPRNLTGAAVSVALNGVTVAPVSWDFSSAQMTYSSGRSRRRSKIRAVKPALARVM
jgi:hypothetical protein